VEYIVFLNPDMEVDIDWLDKLVAFAKINPQAALVQAKVLFYSEKYRVNSIGNPLHLAGFSWSGGFKELSSLHLVPKSIPLASGSSFLIRTEVLNKIGWFDEKLFMYHEDVDLSWRARLAGYEIYLAPEAKAFHKYTFSFGTKKFYYAERNRLVVLFSNYRLLTLILLIPFLLFTEVAMLLYAFFTGWLKYKLLSWLGFLVMIPHIIKNRWRLRSIRKIADRQILQLMTSRLDFEALSSPFITYLYNPLARVYLIILRALIHW
jgi:GT2 family glycosyltransferase